MTTPATLRGQTPPPCVVYAPVMQGTETPGRLAELLVAQIEHRGIRQADAAVLLGTSQQTLSKWCNGVHQPGPDALPTIADFLGLPLAEVQGMVPRRPVIRSTSRGKLRELEGRVDALTLRVASLAERVEALADRLDRRTPPSG